MIKEICNFKKERIFGIALVLGMVVPAYAGSWYVGSGFGAGRAASASSNVSSGLSSFTNALHASNLSYRFSGSYDKGRGAADLFGGYQVNPYFGLELGYTDFGSYKANVSGNISSTTPPVTTLPFNLNANDKIHLFSLAAVGS